MLSILCICVINYLCLFSLPRNINPCNLKEGGHVIVLFTMFSGTDPHNLLLQVAQRQQMSVYFGLPAVPRLPSGNIWWDYVPQYIGFVYRVLMVHELKYE